MLLANALCRFREMAEERIAYSLAIVSVVGGFGAGVREESAGDRRVLASDPESHA